jgi:hypothetical protein
MSADRELIFAAARLARSSPDNWKQFLGAFRAYADQHRDNCIQSAIPTLQVAQGRAQLAALLLQLLTDSVANADKIEGKRK